MFFVYIPVKDAASGKRCLWSDPGKGLQDFCGAEYIAKKGNKRVFRRYRPVKVEGCNYRVFHEIFIILL